MTAARTAVKPWPQPRRQQWAERPADPASARYYSVERAIELGSDEYAETEWALAWLRTLRPDLDDDTIVDRVYDLIRLADETADAENNLGVSPERYAHAVDEYDAALTRFADSGPDRDLMAIVRAVERPRLQLVSS